MAETAPGLEHALVGDQHYAQGQFAQALDAYAQALEVQPHNVYWRFLAGESLFHLGRYDDVVAVLHDLNPGADATLAIEHALTLGRALQQIGQNTAAEMQLTKAFMLAPGHEEAAYNLAVFYEQTGMPEQAIALLQVATQQLPQSVRLHHNLGSLLAHCGRTAAAQAVLEHTLALAPKRQSTHHNLALVLLRQGQLAGGWAHYAWRFNRQAFEGAPAEWAPHTPSLPADLRVQSVQVLGEQGIGDELFFMRYLPALQARGARVDYRLCNSKLASLRHQPALAAWLSGGHAEPAQHTLLAGDLPLALGENTYPAAVALQADASTRLRLVAQHPLLGRARPRLGLAWRAGTQMQYADFSTQRWLEKAVPLGLLLDLLAPLGVDIVILQRGLLPEELAEVHARLGPERVLDASALDEDLDELLALLSCLDGLLGVSNTNVHLAAGLGLGGDVLVPAPAEFRWQEQGTPSPWFPGFAVHRQGAGAGWQAAMASLAASLHARYASAQRL